MSGLQYYSLVLELTCVQSHFHWGKILLCKAAYAIHSSTYLILPWDEKSVWHFYTLSALRVEPRSLDLTSIALTTYSETTTLPLPVLKQDYSTQTLQTASSPGFIIKQPLSIFFISTLPSVSLTSFIHSLAVNKFVRSMPR